jgi:hypothetical protein
MSLSRKIECISCEAVFTILYNMDDNFYEVKYCAFCSEELEFTDELEVEDEEGWPDDLDL